MKPQKVFKRYDIRGKYPEELDEEFADQLAAAVKEYLDSENDENRLIVCKDTKESSGNLKSALVDSLIQKGVSVVDVGTGPTDYASYCCQKYDLTGVMITSSHMPTNFNGFKFIYPRGTSFVNDDLNKLERYFGNQINIENEGTVDDKNLTDEYVEEIVSTVREFTEVDTKTVALDTCGGAAEKVLPNALRELGHDIINVNENADSTITHDPPNAKPEIMNELEEKVREGFADAGVGTDLDADRVTVHDEKDWLSGEEIFSILAKEVEGNVVASIDTPSKVLETSEDVEYTKIGDPFVLNKMYEKNAELSGEPNGHYSIPRFNNYNSGSLIGALLASMDLKQARSSLPDLHTEKENIETDSKQETMEKFIEKVNQDPEKKIISSKDGIKFSENSVNTLVRPSGSSPVIRIVSNSDLEQKALDSVEKTASELEELIP